MPECAARLVLRLGRGRQSMRVFGRRAASAIRRAVSRRSDLSSYIVDRTPSVHPANLAASRSPTSHVSDDCGSHRYVVAVSDELALPAPRRALREGGSGDTFRRLGVVAAHDLRGGPRNTRRGLSRAGHSRAPFVGRTGCRPSSCKPLDAGRLTRASATSSGDEHRPASPTWRIITIRRAVPPRMVEPKQADSATNAAKTPRYVRQAAFVRAKRHLCPSFLKRQSGAIVHD